MTAQQEKNPMGRTLGPFTDVSTVRVDGAYEIYRGLDDSGTEFEILTLGTTSSKDPTRRALLSDTLAWAQATRGPADAEITSADLDCEQPYVVTRREAGLRGVERMLERMLAMGPSTGPLPVTPGPHTGQLPAVGQTGSIPVVTGQTDHRGIPRVVSTPPAGSPVAPDSPMGPYVSKEQRSRSPWLIPVAAMLGLVVLAAGGLLVYFGIFRDGGSGDTAAGAEEPQSEEKLERPVWKDDLAQVIVVGSSSFAPDEGQTTAKPGWPFAFKVPEGFKCATGDDLSATCENTMAEERSTITMILEPCPQECPESVRGEREATWEATNPESDRIDDYTLLHVEPPTDTYAVRMNRFFTTQNNEEELGKYMQLDLIAEGPGTADDLIDPVVNDIATQTPGPP